MHCFDDWLALHGLRHETIHDILTAFRASELRALPALRSVFHSQSDPNVYPDQSEALKEFVIPALLGQLGSSNAVISALARIRFIAPETPALPPHVIDHGEAGPPRVVMAWSGDALSVLHLAHEVAHAVQINLSQGSAMPPLARETCAFLGELGLIAHLNRNGPEWFAGALLNVWHAETQTILGDDLERFLAAMQDDGARYHYRQNYPIARLVASEMFTQGPGPWLEALFASGSDAMAHLPLAQMANAAGRRANYLPALPMSSTDQPALGAYRSLGAIALLEIEYWNGVSEMPLGDVYQGLLQHMQKQTAFIALDRHHRPLGYATWEQAPEANRITLTRQAAPFGDHLELQKSLSRHLQLDAGVASRNARSARPEQEAW